MWLYLLVIPLEVLLFLWSISQPKTACYVFVGSQLVLGLYLFLADKISRPRLTPDIGTRAEREIIRKYHLALRYPLGAKTLSRLLNCLRWTGLLWIPWMLWHHLWPAAVWLGVFFFATASLSVRLDPFFFLREGVKSNPALVGELIGLTHVASKIRAAQQRAATGGLLPEWMDRPGESGANEEQAGSDLADSAKEVGPQSEPSDNISDDISMDDFFIPRAKKPGEFVGRVAKMFKLISITCAAIASVDLLYMLLAKDVEKIYYYRHKLIIMLILLAGFLGLTAIFSLWQRWLAGRKGALTTPGRSGRVDWP